MIRDRNMTVLQLIRVGIGLVTFFSVVLELVFFFSIENLCGCVMTIITTWVFLTFFLHEDIIVDHPFPFLMYLSMFLYHFLPLPCTLLERKPISYGMEMATTTFLLETVMFCIGSFAFYLTVRRPLHNRGVTKLLNTFSFFADYSDTVIIVVGLIGFIAKISALIALPIGALKSVLSGLVGLMYAPILLFFPNLYDSEREMNLSRPMVWVYTIVVFIMSFGTNSRYALLTPFGIFAILYFLSICKNKMTVEEIANPKRIIAIVLIVFVGLSVVDKASEAMLKVRNIRNDVSFTELLSVTFESITELKTEDIVEVFEVKEPSKYVEGWTEEYLDNFMLNRYANMRISDETLYLASLLDENEIKVMRKDFYDRIILTFPNPVIKMLGSDLNKDDYKSSRGDLLNYYAGNGSSYTLGNLIVTSSLADGLIQFGLLYYLLQFFLWHIMFRLLDSMCYRYNGETFYSLLSLISVFTILGMYRNANGCLQDISYIIRYFWEDAFLFIVAFFLARSIVYTFYRKR